MLFGEIEAFLLFLMAVFIFGNLCFVILCLQQRRSRRNCPMIAFQSFLYLYHRYGSRFQTFLISRSLSFCNLVNTIIIL